MCPLIVVNGCDDPIDPEQRAALTLVPALIRGTSLGEGRGQFLFVFAPLDIFGGENERERLAEGFFFRVAEDLTGSAAPFDDFALSVGDEDGVVGQVFGLEPEPRVAVPLFVPVPLIFLRVRFCHALSPNKGSRRMRHDHCNDEANRGIAFIKLW